MGEKIELKDALQMIANQMKGIMVPVELTRQIADPICIAIENLEECIAALEEKKQEAEGNGDGVIEIGTAK